MNEVLMSKDNANVTFPAGEYYIGDACYVLHEVWDEICNDFFFVNRDDIDCDEGEYTLKDGRRVFIGYTAYGDGRYSLSDGGSVGVDAGCIGIIRVEDIDQTVPNNNINFGEIRTFNKPFEVVVNKGVFVFGDIVIDTANDGDDEYEEDDYYDEDEDE